LLSGREPLLRAGLGHSHRVVKVESDGVRWDTAFDRADQATSETKDPGGANVVTSLVYDTSGNLTRQATSATDQTWHEYDTAERLVAVKTTNGTGTAASFTLDALGRPKTRVVGGTTDTYAYVGSSETVHQIVAGATTTDAFIGPSGERAGLKQSSTTNWYLPDLHGDVAGQVTTAGSLAAAYRYDPYGRTVGSPYIAGLSSPWRYQAALDLSPVSSDQLYDIGARFYVPWTGTWSQQDVVTGQVIDPLSMHRFLYAQANPATLIDPTGLSVYAPRGCGPDGVWCGMTSPGSSRDMGRPIPPTCQKCITYRHEPAQPLDVLRIPAAFAGAAVAGALAATTVTSATIATATNATSTAGAAISAVRTGGLPGLCYAFCQRIPELIDEIESFFSGRPFLSPAIVSARATVATGDVAPGAAHRVGIPSAPLADGVPEAKYLAGSIRQINPTRDRMNCVSCVVAVDASLTGHPASAVPGGPRSIQDLAEHFGGSFRTVSGEADVAAILVRAGPGARGVVFGAVAGRNYGHVFNAVNQRGTVRFLDGQTGGEAAFLGLKDLRFMLIPPDAGIRVWKDIRGW
jgi:filamentous hemagglutinin